MSTRVTLSRVRGGETGICNGGLIFFWRPLYGAYGVYPFTECESPTYEGFRFPFSSTVLASLLSLSLLVKSEKYWALLSAMAARVSVVMKRLTNHPPTRFTCK